jgi:hypothetical protein
MKAFSAQFSAVSKPRSQDAADAKRDRCVAVQMPFGIGKLKADG